MGGVTINRKDNPILNTGELLLLKEEIPEITSTGGCRMQTKYIKLKDNLKFVSCVLQKLYGFNQS